jgi:hypothetical protein
MKQVMNLANRPILRGISVAAIASGIQLCAVVGLTPTPAHAQNCNSGSIPGNSPLTLQRADGQTVSLQSNSRGYYRTAHVWTNGNYVGQYNIPFQLADGEIQVRLRARHRLETWLGKVRQVYKQVPYVVVCGNWTGNLQWQ